MTEGGNADGKQNQNGGSELKTKQRLTQEKRQEHNQNENCYLNDQSQADLENVDLCASLRAGKERTVIHTKTAAQRLAFFQTHPARTQAEIHLWVHQ